jgi:hypothetical protein
VSDNGRWRRWRHGYGNTPHIATLNIPEKIGESITRTGKTTSHGSEILNGGGFPIGGEKGGQNNEGWKNKRGDPKTAPLSG